MWVELEEDRGARTDRPALSQFAPCRTEIGNFLAPAERKILGRRPKAGLGAPAYLSKNRVVQRAVPA